MCIYIHTWLMLVPLAEARDDCLRHYAKHRPSSWFPFCSNPPPSDMLFGEGGEKNARFDITALCVHGMLLFDQCNFFHIYA